MTSACESQELSDCFQNHLEETKDPLNRIESILKRVNGSLTGGKSCKAMERLITEGEECVKALGNPAVADAGLIAAAHQVEHYEIAAYGCAKTYAELPGDEESARLLGQSLEEEKSANKKLNDLAINRVNPVAAHA